MVYLKYQKTKNRKPAATPSKELLSRLSEFLTGKPQIKQRKEVIKNGKKI
nr:MAG TPA: hypothetical protein [Caudoviricetes sp.]